VENLTSKPFFRDSFEKRRCLVPINGWYEFQGARGNKDAYYMTTEDGAPIAWAGIWDAWTSPGGEVVTSFTVITTEPSELVKPFHPRMAVMLAPDDYDRWLEPENNDTAALTAMLLRGYEPRLVAKRVSGYVNSVHNEGPRCLEPPEQGVLF
jgi:putative SOS response-associated peptidase YedK